MQKGFTLIEMAIVLVIIGLITSLAMKGNDLMDQITWKRDVQSYEHLQAAILLFRESRGHMPGDEDGDGIIQGRETKAAYEELTTTAGLEKKDFIFKTGGPLYFGFTECEKTADAYEIEYTKYPDNTCIFPSELKPWISYGNDVLPEITSELIVCIFEVGFDDKNVYTGNIRRARNASWGTSTNTDLKNMESALDCFSSDISDEATKTWKDSIIIGLW
ncbi:MAG: prepilin-type N-terminal cleavage/methylation domain-containing protein [Bacilli bacterium]